MHNTTAILQCPQLPFLCRRFLADPDYKRRRVHSERRLAAGMGLAPKRCFLLNVSPPLWLP